MIASVKPLGTMVLVELLSPNEMMGTSLYVGENAKDEDNAPRAYLKGWGHSLDADKWGLKVNDLVILTGTYIPTPVKGEKNRRLVLVEFSALKGILLEE